MKLIPIGDYYAWYCDWCDSRNLTLWTRVEKNKVYCGACHRQFTMGLNESPGSKRHMAAGMI